MASNFKFDNPFPRNHCVVLAFAHAAGLDQDGAVALAERARAADGNLLNKKGIGLSRPAPAFGRWCYLTGKLRPGLITIEAPNMTLEQFARAHPTGRWIVYVHRHAVALIDGVIYGYYKPRSRVQLARDVVLNV